MSDVNSWGSSRNVMGKVTIEDSIPVNQEVWSTFRKARKEKFRERLAAERKKLTRHKEAVKETKRRIVQYEEEIDTVDEKCVKAGHNYEVLYKMGLRRLSRKVADAIQNRDICHVIGLVAGFSNVEYSSYGMKIQYQWWCSSWFLGMLDRVDKSSDVSRQHMYNHLSDMKDLQTQEEIEEEIGMFVLKLI